MTRNITEYTVKSIDEKEGYYSVLTEDGTGFGVSEVVGAHLFVGTVFELETIGFSRITGVRLNGVWLEQKSDEEIEAEDQKRTDEFNRQNRERLAAGRDDWQRREEALPDWLQDRIAVFHTKGGEHFAESGWEYELTVAELAALIAEHGEADKEGPVADYAREQGISGNQWGVAVQLVRLHNSGRELTGTVSALAPLTGSAYYEVGE